TSQRAAESDLYDLVEFYDQNDMLLNASSRLPGILSWGKICFIKIDHEIVSCALTTTETDDAAMIGAVYTATRFRNNGYAKDCILHLCRDLVLEYKKPYLFYRSEDDLLRGFYYSIGFRPISDWILATRK
ncbi:MAG: GNAT family N-acetyltransferase, partial [Chitinophagales bacterium]